MNSIAIIRATDILRLKSTLMEMNQAGLDFEGKPKEINLASAEKTLSELIEISNKNYEVCALVPVSQDYETCRNRIKGTPHSDVLILDNSSEFFKSFARLIPILPDLDTPNIHYKDIIKQTDESKGRSDSKPNSKSDPDLKGKPSTVYLGVFVNRKVQVQTDSGAIYTGILRHADSIGVFFEPSDGSAPAFITWHDIKKIIIPREEKK